LTYLSFAFEYYRAFIGIGYSNISLQPICAVRGNIPIIFSYLTFFNLNDFLISTIRYSIRDEAFYTEGELVDGKAPTGAAVEWVKEESYFFKLSEWTEKLLKFYDENPDFIGPKGRRAEVISFVSQEGGLRDLSVSRTTFSWGVPVPGNPKHVVYVWLDALTNYITAIDYPDMDSSGSRYPKFWPAALHVVGKDILRFHAVFWPAFLLAAGLEPPKVR
jgi:methionyl-tRNA synthetase